MTQSMLAEAETIFTSPHPLYQTVRLVLPDSLVRGCANYP